MSEDCIFCKIANGEIPSEKIAETEKEVAFYDKHPEAPVHILIVPKKHISSIKEEGSENIACGLIKLAKQIAKDKNIAGYKLLFNVGEEGGQTINHLHLHLLSGKVYKPLAKVSP